MKKLKEINKWVDKHQTIIVLSLIFVFMLILNFLTPLLRDDIDYSYIWHTDHKINNIVDVIASQYKHYFNWGGRTVAHTIAQFFLMFPKFIFNIVNSLVYVGIIYKINSIATNKKQNGLIMLGIHLVLFLLVPLFGEDFIWLVGSCNYAWTLLIILCFIDYYVKSKLKDSKTSIILLAFLGIVAGWTNENVSVALVLIISCFLLKQKLIDKKKIEKWKISGFIGSVVGAILLIGAPGNFIRSAEFVDDTFFIIRYLKRMVEITKTGYHYLWPILLGLLILFTYYFYKKKKPDINNYIYLFGAVIAMYAMTASPYFPDRAWIGIIIFLIIPFVNLFDKVIEKERLIRFAFYDCLIVLMVLCASNYYRLAGELKYYNEIINERKQYIKEHPDQEEYTFKSHIIEDRYSPLQGEDLTPDRTSWINEAEAHRYGVKYIIGY